MATIHMKMAHTAKIHIAIITTIVAARHTIQRIITSTMIPTLRTTQFTILHISHIISLITINHTHITNRGC